MSYKRKLATKPVEDVEETRDGIEQLLTADGYRVAPARDEEDAVVRAKRAPPHLILVSLGGPAIEVIATAARIRDRAQLSQGVPVVLFCIPIPSTRGASTVAGAGQGQPLTAGLQTRDDVRGGSQ